MGLQLTILQSTGAKASYHNIAETVWSKSAQTSSHTIASYLDYSTRMAGASPLSVRVYLQPGTLALQTDAQIYTYIKTLPAFSGATDL